MALRTVHFTYDQILWECHQTRRAQYFHLRLPCDDEDWAGNKGKRINIHNLRNPQTPDEGGALKHMWNAIVHTYTTCRLTFSGDKLVAIGAIAARITAQTGDEYVAGLWRHDMPQNLAWTPMPYRGRLPPTYRSPSWSWAAIDGPVPTSVPYYVDDPRPLVAIDSCTIQSATGSRFGPITGAELQLRGRLVPLWAYCESELWVSDWRVHVGADEPGREADFAQVARMMFCDVESPAGVRVALSALPIYVSDLLDDPVVHCLVLQAVAGDNRGAFRRFGVWSFSAEEIRDLESLKDLEDLVSRYKQGGEALDWPPSWENVVLV